MKKDARIRGYFSKPKGSTSRNVCGNASIEEYILDTFFLYYAPFSRDSIKLYVTLHKNCERHGRVSRVFLFYLLNRSVSICSLTFSPPANVRHAFIVMSAQRTNVYVQPSR